MCVVSLVQFTQFLPGELANARVALYSFPDFASWLPVSRHFCNLFRKHDSSQCQWLASKGHHTYRVTCTYQLPLDCTAMALLPISYDFVDHVYLNWVQSSKFICWGGSRNFKPHPTVMCNRGEWTSFCIVQL